MKTKLVRIYAVDWESLKKIKSKQGFPNYAETVEYVLQKFPETTVEKGIVQTSHINPGNPASPIKVIGVGGKEFIQIGGEKL